MASPSGKFGGAPGHIAPCVPSSISGGNLEPLSFDRDPLALVKVLSSRLWTALPLSKTPIPNPILQCEEPPRGWAISIGVCSPLANFLQSRESWPGMSFPSSSSKRKAW